MFEIQTICDTMHHCIQTNYLKVSDFLTRSKPSTKDGKPPRQIQTTKKEFT